MISTKGPLVKEHPRVLVTAVVTLSRGIVAGIIVTLCLKINLAVLARYWCNNRKLASLETSSKIEKGSKIRADRR